MMIIRGKLKGFTLIEMMLVLVIVSMLIYMAAGYLQQKALSSRIDRTTLQMQQILNAGLSYYISNGQWPPGLACLQGIATAGFNCAVQYLPSPMVSPWGKTYQVDAPKPPALLYVSIPITQATASGSAAATANIIAGKLPLSYTTTKNGTPPVAGTACVKGSVTCYVVGSVNIPGQNLNNATAVNFIGLVHHGGCVPVPTCPVDASGNTMTPEIIVVPASVSGINGAVKDPATGKLVVYPISSFTAYATTNVAGQPSTTRSPPLCTGGGTPSSGTSDCSVGAVGLAAKFYWRVCLDIVTDQGDVQATTPLATKWGSNVTAAAFTRCSVNNESSGGFNVYE